MMIKDFLPISLCNVCCKIIARELTNKLRPILAQIIEDSQCAFVSSRLISDYMIVGFELTHRIQNKHTGKNGYAAFKLDISKAYDWVEWGFLEEVMRGMGFSEN